MDEIHENQASEVLPYHFEPEPGQNSNCSKYSSDCESESSSDEDNEMKAFEIENAWHFDTLKWCKCGHCSVHNKVIENFCCKEK